jgi:GH24 family phage-related lysozyme (muramidase)
MATEYIWPITTLIMFLGMLALCWRALAIAHDLAKTVLAQTGPTPPPKPTPAPPLVPPKPAPIPAPVVPPAPDVVLDQAYIAWLKKEEGFTAKATWDYKQYSIGYGTKATSATEVIDEPTASARLIAEVTKAMQLVESFAPAAPKGVKQALTDLTYNAGEGWEHAGLGATIKAGNYEAAKSILLQYNHAGGVVNAGLTARREAEVTWFDKPL